ncbi:MAG: metallopeptidase family protein [Propionibacteriaceae bacterium]|jgi:predicted Zn-dependent protease with MMP-like domain|nr:metallopeptidase family protein [Propionibacteriaceae bacterium]
MAIEISDDDFDELVAEAIDRVPKKFLDSLDNVVILVDDEPMGPMKNLYGLYQGIPATSRGDVYAAALPDRIYIYRTSHKQMAQSLEELRTSIYTTVVHEIAHHFGIDDDQLHEWGW